MTSHGTILIVDDNPVNLELLSETLTEEGYQVLPAKSGELALAAIAARLPELILLDIRMPGLDGFEVCRRLRAREDSRDIPVVFISAIGETAERVEGLKLGAVDFISKPFQRQELLARVQTHLELRRLRVRLESQATDLRQVNEQLEKDITNRKAIEAQLQCTLADLERSNQELEQFAYVASHDLQEPLRMVSSYAQLLSQRYAGQLDEKAQKYIHYAVDGAIRMQTLINDLLAYSRVGRQGKALAPTDSHAVLGGALRNLAATIEETRAIITNDDLPTVRADASQLVLVFQNLLANAIKFRGPDLPRIHVSAQENGREWVFAVRDNGIGIEPQHARRVFVIFQRLHTRAEYSGTGIGLAVCQRIVERHGGRIWFESEPGKGATFFFTVPK